MKNRNLQNHNNWKTPNSLYQKLNHEFNFDFDPCPLNSTFDGLSIDWGERNYINPPYSQKLKEAFIKKAYEEAVFNKKLCVMLLPVSTSTKIFHKYIYDKAEIRFIKKRVKFDGINTFGDRVSNKCGMHDSMIVIFRPKNTSIITSSPLYEFFNIYFDYNADLSIQKSSVRNLYLNYCELFGKTTLNDTNFGIKFKIFAKHDMKHVTKSDGMSRTRTTVRVWSGITLKKIDIS
ncbi:MAG: DNA N-6-adenine-methyltransferase [Candidatus Methanoperedens sp.]|nr:DNA N-6-adenine-methyltransferase [Candidatus Methanoperedens sp.]CAG0949232.1 hypothetical protein METP1_00091 [Methanosarcinales archaeon]